ncbi:hypothetical protein F3Y22_tig00111745pilonHSYRG00092 [Hibiscus syriacus]|uniref:Uncharacterized protein n=1 Tax=Hibiscus syriacus TaxID=106335 RepID=A0A6A2YHV7_HIBSY|nr:hypothetical protein F3Y22_tig00111745pilonHSYRG00092 [Hibiscus syriacus]
MVVENYKFLTFDAQEGKKKKMVRGEKRDKTDEMRRKECPLGLKEATSSICFAAPRCTDLPELLHVQMLFTSKYGKEFVSAATELQPDCGVNRQLIELLSVRAPSPEIKLKFLKEIAEEHELEWDPASTETQFFKPHEDLLANLPQIPKVSLQPSGIAVSAPVISPPSLAAPKPGVDCVSSVKPWASGYWEPKKINSFCHSFLLHYLLHSARPSDRPPAISRPKSEANIDLRDVLAVVQAAAETAENAAAATRLAASLAQSPDSHQVHQVIHQASDAADLPSINKPKIDFSSPVSRDHDVETGSPSAPATEIAFNG